MLLFIYGKIFKTAKKSTAKLSAHKVGIMAKHFTSVIGILMDLYWRHLNNDSNRLLVPAFHNDWIANLTTIGINQDFQVWQIPMILKFFVNLENPKKNYLQAFEIYKVIC